MKTFKLETLVKVYLYNIFIIFLPIRFFLKWLKLAIIYGKLYELI